MSEVNTMQNAVPFAELCERVAGRLHDQLAMSDESAEQDAADLVKLATILRKGFWPPLKTPYLHEERDFIIWLP